MGGLVRKTKQREIILEELCKLTSHPTADELYFIVREKLPRISLGTIYRNLEIMAEEGIIRKIVSGSKISRFDGNTSQHFHLRCVHCERVFDLMLDDYSEFDELVKKLIKPESDFEVYNYDLIITGICKDCKNKKKTH